MSTALPPSGDSTEPGAASPSPRSGAASAGETGDSFHDPALSHLPELRASDLGQPGRTLDQHVGDPAAGQLPPQRGLLLPTVLFAATCASTFWVGATHWEPLRPDYFATWELVGATVRNNWQNGLSYMIAVVAILLTHEMGHFLQTVRYGIPASFPLCIPVPFNAIGTMGAVIGMEASRANRRQIFDIGIAGPLAGLVVAFPVLWIGIKQLDLSGAAHTGEIEFYLPLAAQWMLRWAHPDAAWAGERWVAMSELNPYFMAGWVGMLITGLNMLPVSQLDGGHTIYALFREGADFLAQLFISFAILYVVINLDHAVLWTPMLLLVILLGIHHPPTADDDVPLGPLRWTIGLASLAIPVLCFPLLGVRP
jgi:Zn-dependent protease